MLLWAGVAWLTYQAWYAAWAAVSPSNAAWQREAEVRAAWAVGLLLGAAVNTVCFLAVGLRGRRARIRLQEAEGVRGERCGSCGYARGGLAAAAVCPECGEKGTGHAGEPREREEGSWRGYVPRKGTWSMGEP